MKSLLVVHYFVVSGSYSTVHWFLLCSSRQGDKVLHTFSEEGSFLFQSEGNFSASFRLLVPARYCCLLLPYPPKHCSKTSLGM